MSRRHAGKKSLSQIFQVQRAQEVLSLSEEILLEALTGKLNVSDRLRVSIALELYKRRVPIKIEEQKQSGNSLTMIKIVKNFLPEEGTRINNDKVTILESYDRKEEEGSDQKYSEEI
jgi:hypothetical protein